MNGIDIVIVTALVLLVALAVAAGLQLAQDRAEAQLSALTRQTRVLQQEQLRLTPARYCVNCGRELRPPTSAES